MAAGSSERSLSVLIEPWDSCIGCGACEAVCPEVFRVDDDRGVAVVSSDYIDGEPWRGAAPAGLRECVERASKACPVSIIRLAQER